MALGAQVMLTAILGREAMYRGKVLGLEGARRYARRSGASWR